MGDELVQSIMGPSAPGRGAEIRPLESDFGTTRPAGSPNAPSFADTLRQSIAEVNQLKTQADAATEDLAVGKSTDIQGTILAMQKADISFRVMMEVRNKIVSAYQEVMRTQV